MDESLVIRANPDCGGSEMGHAEGGTETQHIGHARPAAAIPNYAVFHGCSCFSMPNGGRIDKLLFCSLPQLPQQYVSTLQTIAHSCNNTQAIKSL